MIPGTQLSLLVFFPCLSVSPCIVQRAKGSVLKGIPTQFLNLNCLPLGRQTPGLLDSPQTVFVYICSSKYLRNKDCVHKVCIT